MTQLLIILIAALCLLALAYQAMLATASIQQRRNSARMRDQRFTHERIEQVQQQLKTLTQNYLAQVRPIPVWRDVVVAQVVDESPTCKSFYLLDPCNERLPQFLPGQHIVVEVQFSGNPKPVRRCYSLSSISSKGYWRITVRNSEPGEKNSIADYLHTFATVGKKLRVRGPQGDFTAQQVKDKPMVLLAAGIGITPLLSILEEWVSGDRSQPVWMFYQVRDNADVPFLGRLLEIAKKHSQFQFHLHVTRPSLTNFDVPYFERPVCGEHVVEQVPCEKAFYFMCGPEGWMSLIAGSLVGQGVSDNQIVYESFGGVQAHLPRVANDHLVCKKLGNVTFLKTAQTVAFDSLTTNLLEFAESQGVAIDSGCRSGNCGTCITRLLKGNVKYRHRPQCEHADDEIVACVAEPDGDIVLDV
jgi:uncharacterized protein